MRAHCVRFRVFSITVVAVVTIFARQAAAQGTFTCSAAPELEAAYASYLKASADAMRKQVFDQRIRPRRRSADLSSATPASDPLQFVGGVTDTGGNVKIRTGVSFLSFGTADLTATIPDSALASLKKSNLLDGLDVPQAFTIRPRVSWTKWNGTPSEALQKDVCSQAQEFNQRQTVLGRQPSTSDFLEFRKTQLNTNQEQRALAGPSSGQPASAPALLDVGNQLVFDASYEAGHQSFEYADPALAYAKTDASYSTHALSVAAGVVHPFETNNASLVSAVITYKRQHAYQAADSGSLCHPLGSSSVSQCEDLSIGAPTVSDTNNAQIDLRYWGTHAFSPGIRVTRNFTQGLNTFEVPVYFMGADFTAKSTAGFTGGVTLGYRDSGPSKGKYVAVILGTFLRPTPVTQ